MSGEIAFAGLRLGSPLWQIRRGSPIVKTSDFAHTLGMDIKAEQLPREFNRSRIREALPQNAGRATESLAGPGRLRFLWKIIRSPDKTTRSPMRRAKSNTSKNFSADLGFEAKLWLATDKLRSNMDEAEHKQVVLDLIFLKYFRRL